MEHLFAVLRSEWMRKHAANTPSSAEAMPLQFSADAFSGFGAIDHARYAHAIHATMRHMKYGIMPSVADSLERWWSNKQSAAGGDLTLPVTATQLSSGEAPATLSSSISQLLHAEGINMRFLALVRSYVALPSSPSSLSSSLGTPVPLPSVLSFSLI